MAIYNFTKGHLYFKERVFKQYEQHFAQLVKQGQCPKALFISCIDSRISPHLILNAQPGDLLILRNIGNFIPTYDVAVFNETRAILEFAINFLNIQEVIVCGHTHCAACRMLYQRPEEPELSGLNHWLAQGDKIKSLIFEAKEEPLTLDEALYATTEKISILCQIENLLSYPFIQEKIDQNDLNLHAWYYDIETGDIAYYDESELDYLHLITP